MQGAASINAKGPEMSSTAHPRMHILLATDGSAQAVEAARFVPHLANPNALGRITVLAVVRPITSAPFFAIGGVPQDVWDRLNESAESAAKKAIQQIVSLLDG